MTGINANIVTVFVIMLQCIDAQARRFVSEPSIGKNMIRTVQDEFLWVDMVQVPFERFAMLFLFENHSIGHIAHLGVDQVGSVHVKEPFVVVHPDLNGSGRVDAMSVFVVRKRIGMERAEDVADT